MSRNRCSGAEPHVDGRGTINAMADRELELLREEVRAHRAESREFIRWMVMSFEQQTAAIKDLRDQVQANTRAVLRVLDRLDDLPGAQA
jgi:hypothetical protein